MTPVGPPSWAALLPTAAGRGRAAHEGGPLGYQRSSGPHEQEFRSACLCFAQAFGPGTWATRWTPAWCVLRSGGPVTPDPLHNQRSQRECGVRSVQSVRGIIHAVPKQQGEILVREGMIAVVSFLIADVITKMAILE